MRDYLVAVSLVLLLCGCLIHGGRAEEGTKVPKFPLSTPLIASLRPTQHIAPSHSAQAQTEASSSSPTQWPTSTEMAPVATTQGPVQFVKGPSPGPSWAPRRAPRNLDDSSRTIPTCYNFSVGNPDKGEFFSPNYPNNYPNHTDCIRVLSTSPGRLLQLDFRDEFHLEPSEDCRFDYLEVRDGAHGFAKQLGLFCGNTFPPMITSSDRFLWLRFHSDENVEYSGFRAVYTDRINPAKVPVSPMENCKFEVTGMEGSISKTNISTDILKYTVEHRLNLDCMWIISVREGWKIMLSFQKFKLENPNDCESNYLDVFSDVTDMPHRLKNFCGSIADSVTSASNLIHVRFFTEAKAVNSTFEALFTAFRDKPTGQTCASDEYDCEDATCIASTLRCNGRINCRFRWDEDECTAKKGSILMNSEHIIIILVMFCLILFGMCFAFVFNCVRKLVRDHRIMQEKKSKDVGRA